MVLPELNPDERIALVGLVRMCVEAEPAAVAAEADYVAALVEALGEDGFRVARAGAESLQGEAMLHAALGKVRPEARELIYGFVREAAMVSGIVGREAALLAWLEKEWGIVLGGERDKSPYR